MQTNHMLFEILLLYILLEFVRVGVVVAKQIALLALLVVQYLQLLRRDRIQPLRLMLLIHSLLEL